MPHEMSNEEFENITLKKIQKIRIGQEGQEMFIIRLF